MQPIQKLDPSIAKEIYDQIPLQYCKTCCIPLPRAIQHYPHPDGWVVRTFAEKQWLFIQCPTCGNQITLWKLGYGRNSVETDMLKESVEAIKTMVLTHIRTENQKKDLLPGCPKCHSKNVTRRLDDYGQYYAVCKNCHNAGVMTVEVAQEWDAAYAAIDHLEQTSES